MAELLAVAGYSLQANRKTGEGTTHPDRVAQFRYINRQVRRFQAAAQPVISVDTTKMELVGDSKAPGAQWRSGGPFGRVHDFIIPAFPRRARRFPMGSTISRGTLDGSVWALTTDTASFAARTIRRWWQKMGRPR